MHKNFSINSKKRNLYWKNIDIIAKVNDNLMYHIFGADKNSSLLDYKKNADVLLYYVYRFLLEEKILIYFIKKYKPIAYSVLDCGCGTGRNSIVFSKFFSNIKSFDISEQFIEQNKKMFSAKKNIHFFVSDFVNASKLDEKYDIIFIGGVLMYLSDDEVKNVLNYVKSILKDDGILILRDTLTRKNTKKANDVKIYRSEKYYEKLLEDGGFLLKQQTNNANRNIWCSIFRRLPKSIQSCVFIFDIFRKIIKLTSLIDLKKAVRQPFKRHSMSNQLFYVYKKQV
jgi:SAM-dependent methyltransferase